MQTLGTRIISIVGLALTMTAAGCRKDPVAPAQQALIQDGDPANVNMAPTGPAQGYPRTASRAASQPARVLDERESSYPTERGEQYPQQNNYQPQQGAEQLEEADQPPPPLPEYSQPMATRPNTIWTPGNWRHSPNGYYWAPGAWVKPPYTGALWTPGYWAADGNRYRFNQGYWGPHVGFYGGVPYGNGYTGTGYRGGYWDGNRFLYNQAVSHVDPNAIRDIYNQPERIASPYGRLSFNGGNGGIPLLPIAAELIALHEQHVRPVRYQYDVEREAALNRGQFIGAGHNAPEMYFAPDGYLVDRLIERRVVPQTIIVQRPIFNEEEHGRGHAYGHYKNKDHFDKHERGDDDHDGGEGRDKHGKGKGKDKD